MKSNASLKELAGFLKAAETILIFTHTNPDGDALGSAAALCRVLRKMGKTSWILMDEEVPEYISFMDTEFVTRDKDCLKDHDVSICVDCGEYGRFPALADKFDEGKLHLCVDHHATGDGFGDHYYIDPSEAATCQLIYKLIKELEAAVAEGSDAATGLIDKTVAESLYTGINTDTGSFQYSNTTADTHAIAADLMAHGIDHTAINVKLYQTIPMTKLKIQASILQRAEFLFGGKVAVGYVTGQMLEEAGAVLDDAEGTIDMLRNIEGVEIAAFLKEKGEAVKVSMRAKSYANVAEIVSVFGGGGHVKAAGCTLEMGMDEALDAIKKAIGEHF
ncbi:MAG: bifunctional oligoribonuclease/PAP phosphatase NrnA [Firmicutes bacterium]|nr:bifunctional oligoribonuclease/PAP phosphatase NrnA [Bacillota bacterium]